MKHPILSTLAIVLAMAFAALLCWLLVRVTDLEFKANYPELAGPVAEPERADRVEALANLVAALANSVEASERDLSDARYLAAFGGMGMITCDPSTVVDKSIGQAAQRALLKTGLCDPKKPLNH